MDTIGDERMVKSMVKYEIANGINLYHIETDKFKSFSASINIYRNLNAGEAAKNVLMLKVLRSASAQYPSIADMEKKLEWLWGARLIADVKKKGDIQVLSLSAATLSDKYTKASSAQEISRFLLDVFLCPKVTCDGFDSRIMQIEKSNLKNLIMSVLNDKRAYAEKRLVEEMCADAPFGIYELGRVEDVDAITPEELYAHYKQVLAESRMDIFICGSENTADLFRAALCGFGGEKQHLSTKGLKGAVPAKMHEVVEEMETQQCKMAIGFQIEGELTEENYYTYMMYNSVFGGGVHSKLFNHVREKLSLAYYAYSRLIRHKSIVTVATGIELDKYEKTREEVFRQAQEIENGNITDTEFVAARIALETYLRSLSDTPENMQEFYINNLLSGFGGSVIQAIEGIGKVKKEDVISAAAHMRPHTLYFLKNK